jgi:hypothetical protein
MLLVMNFCELCACVLYLKNRNESGCFNSCAEKKKMVMMMEKQGDKKPRNQEIQKMKFYTELPPQMLPGILL